MKFTSEDLMNAMGLAVGDRVKVGYFIYKVVIKDEEINERNIALERENGSFLYIKQLLDQNYEILPRPKRVGDLNCEEISCSKCTLKALCDWDFKFDSTITLLENLKNIENDQEIYNLLKVRLDKEVE